MVVALSVVVDVVWWGVIGGGTLHTTSPNFQSARFGAACSILALIAKPAVLYLAYALYQSRGGGKALQDPNESKTRGTGIPDGAPLPTGDDGLGYQVRLGEGKSPYAEDTL